MGDENLHDPAVDPRLRSKGDESERILQDAFLSGGRDPSGAGKLSATRLAKALQGDEPAAFKEDSSWGSHAEEEGQRDEKSAKGLWRRFLHFFSG